MQTGWQMNIALLDNLTVQLQLKFQAEYHPNTIIAQFEKCNFKKNLLKIVCVETDRPKRFDTTANWTGKNCFLWHHIGMCKIFSTNELHAEQNLDIAGNP